METCGILTRDYQITGEFFMRHKGGGLECLRPWGHGGPHLVHRNCGGYVAFEIDLFCACETCRTSDEPEDWCRIHRRVTPEEAVLLVSTTEEGITLV